MVKRWLGTLAALLLAIPAGARTAPPLQVEWRLPDPVAWEREQLRLLVTVRSPERYASLRLPDWKGEGFEVVPIPPRRHPLPQGGSRLEAGWLLFPRAAGEWQVTAPPVEYRLGGRSERALAPPPRRVTVRALPEWMTPEIPVGRPTLHLRLTAPRWPSTGELMQLEVTMEGEAIHPDWLPSAGSLLPPTAGLRRLPAREWRTLEPDPAGVHGSRRIRIPLRAERSGPLPLPTLRLPWFDPESGRLRVITAEPPRPWVIGPLWHLFLAFLLLTLGVATTPRLRRALAALRRWHARRALIQALRHASGYDETLNQVRRHAIAEGWPPTLTLAQWGEQVERRFGVDGSLHRAIDALLATRFRRGRDDGEAVAALCLALRRRLTATLFFR